MNERMNEWMTLFKCLQYLALKQNSKLIGDTIYTWAKVKIIYSWINGI